MSPLKNEKSFQPPEKYQASAKHPGTASTVFLARSKRVELSTPPFRNHRWRMYRIIVYVRGKISYILVGKVEYC
jgi:hypothetical protein